MLYFLYSITKSLSEYSWEFTTKNESLKNTATQVLKLFVNYNERNEKNVIGINENVYSISI